MNTALIMFTLPSGMPYSMTAVTEKSLEEIASVFTPSPDVIMLIKNGNETWYFSQECREKGLPQIVEKLIHNKSI